MKRKATRLIYVSVFISSAFSLLILLLSSDGEAPKTKNITKVPTDHLSEFRTDLKVYGETYGKELDIDRDEEAGKAEKSTNMAAIAAMENVKTSFKADQNNLKLDLKSQKAEDTKVVDAYSKIKDTSKRQNLLIFGHDRSGTTFTTQLFNQDLRLFTAYEPLWVVKRWMQQNNTLNRDFLALEVLKGFMNCSFNQTEIGREFIHVYSRILRPRSFSRVLSSPPFCTKNVIERCEKIQPDLLDEHCRHKYKSTVVKIATNRTPGKSLSSILSLVENPDFDMKILHLVRDPRGSINSRISAGWIPDYQDGQFKGFANTSCKMIHRNILTGLELNRRIGGKYKFVKYEDICTRPLETARSMFQFAGFDMPKEIEQWVIEKTQPSAEMLELALQNKHSVVRNASGNADRWKEESPIPRVKIIDTVCKPLMDFLGYKFLFQRE